jgi:hypothetical protein
VITEFKNTYPGILNPCGIGYMDFVFLNGDYSKIKSFDELASLKDNALNVVHGAPYSMFLCPYVVKKIDSVNFDAHSQNAVVKIVSKDGKTLEKNRTLVASYDITYMYGQTLRKETAPDQELEYVESKTLPVGKYTIVAFSMSGKISKPLLIEITDHVSTNTTFQFNTVVNSLVDIAGSFTGSNIVSLISLPIVFGSVMFANYRRSGKLSKSFNVAVIVTILTVALIPQIGQNQAFATYNVGSQGLEAHSTTSTFKQATLESQFEGTRYATDANNGFSVQNNQFVQGFTVGNGYLWTQSVIQAESATGTTWNSHTCTTQGGSYTCKLPASVKLRGVYNFWTDDGVFNSCPSGFTYDPSVDECYKLDGTQFNTVTLSSSITRLDLNAYQDIQSDGIHMIQKYRTCTGSFSCGGYTNIMTWQVFSYANSNSRYDLGTPPEGIRWGTQAIVGQCASCNGGSGRVQFLDGTYFTEKYTINSSGTPILRAAGAIDAPTENNDDLCWWDSITNPGGSNPTYSVTARNSISCQS